MKLIEVLSAMPIEELRRRISESRQATSAEVEARQRAERRARAEAAAASIRRA
jgi:hypothetical protein